MFYLDVIYSLQDMKQMGLPLSFRTPLVNADGEEIKPKIKTTKPAGRYPEGMEVNKISFC